MICRIAFAKVQECYVIDISLHYYSWSYKKQNTLPRLLLLSRSEFQAEVNLFSLWPVVGAAQTMRGEELERILHYVEMVFISISISVSMMFSMSSLTL